MNIAVEFISHFTELFIESAPWLLLGLLIAGIMQWLVPISLLQKQLGKNDASSVVKAALIGAPLPLCSCGVIPAAVGLRRAGASKPASIAFLVATPETGVDSISVSYALLGPFMAVIRPVAAILSAIYAGLLVMLVDRAENSTKSSVVINQSNGSCCASQQAKPVEKSCCASEPQQVKKSCCSTQAEQTKSISLGQRLLNSISFASGKLLRDISVWLLIGLAMAALVKTLVPVDFLTQWGGGFIAMAVMALIGIPMYICATASTPLALGFLAAGVSPGAVLVFMLAGPATNISTMGMIHKELGTPVLLSYLFSIFTASIGFGYLTNWIIDYFHISVVTDAITQHGHEQSWLYILCALLLAALMLKNLLRYLNMRFQQPATDSL
ncbi:SO_0444 family Cu/Zn efflux transporter [Neptunicella sp. SCSIO 80796]|uniref:SO_0444 family Cu/Zn efflux transporter n=1 Tax=Neptunicella plasticusilytica TaxID=3117012 RepID=UPI003A4DB104